MTRNQWADDAAFVELFNERAAIMEFDAGLPRAEAEERARDEIEQLWRDKTTKAAQ